MSGFDKFIGDIVSGHIEGVRSNYRDDYLEIEHEGKRPIHFACENERIDVVRFLLEKGCDVESTTSKEQSALELVELSNCQELKDMLSAATLKQQVANISSAMGIEYQSQCGNTPCLITQSINDFKKSDMIFNGEFGNLYKIIDSSSEFELVMKVITNDDECEDRDKKCIELNINRYRDMLRHERIVRYYGAVVESPRMYLFMEYVEGGSLSSEIRMFGSLDITRIANYSLQILEGLGFLHRQAIVHRDLTPRTILLDVSGNIKLANFGLSRLLDDKIPDGTCNSITPITTACGKCNYLAPEVINGEEYRFSADLWSVGATVVEMLTGKPPFHSLSQQRIIQLITETRKIDFPRNISEDLNDFLDQLLQSEPENRGSAENLLTWSFLENA